MNPGTMLGLLALYLLLRRPVRNEVRRLVDHPPYPDVCARRGPHRVQDCPAEHLNGYE